ncbi:hypothetical protein Dimus_003327 [Dionaea muscipula]
MSFFGGHNSSPRNGEQYKRKQTNHLRSSSQRTSQCNTTQRGRIEVETQAKVQGNSMKEPSSTPDTDGHFNPPSFVLGFA